MFAPLVPGLCRRIRAPVILEVNSLGTERARWMRGIDRACLRSVSAIRCVSAEIEDTALAIGGKDIEGRTMLLPNGVDLKRFSVQPLLSRAKRIGYVGTLNALYGLEDLVDAFRTVLEQHPTATLQIVGEGPHRAALERYAKSIRGVVFRGALGFGEIPDLLAQMDVLVNPIPASVSDGSTKLFEYMAAGRPLVHARTKTVEKVVRGSEGGYLFDSAKAGSLAEQILRVLDNPKEAIERSTAARRIVSEEHTWDHRVDAMMTHMINAGVLSRPDS
jgi:glycosyltransferase involved in cell wall biosynthesis